MGNVVTSATTSVLTIAAILVVIGCDGATRVAAESAKVDIYVPRHVTEDIDWGPVADDYDATMFMVMDVLVDGKSVKLLGFLPYLDYCLRSSEGEHTPWDLSPFTLPAFGVGSRHNSWLFVMVKNGKASCLLVSDTQSPAFSSRIHWYEMSARESEFVEVLPGTVWVEPSFWEHLRERKVSMPARYKPLPQLWWDSQKHEPEKNE